jgi:glucose-6-phosphate dehydrogenase assembly protein OpcA
MVTLWDTTGGDVVSALAAERRVAGAVTSGLALTLVVSVDEPRVAEATQAAAAAAAAHPCRLLVVVRRSLDSDNRLDAEVSIGGRFGPAESVVLRMWGRLTLHAESVVLPLLAPDAPVVTWWHGPPPEQSATDPLGVLADRRITDCVQAADPLAALRARADDYAPGDTDLAWARTTRWRSLLASTFDTSPGTATAGRVAAEAGSPTAALLAGWLRARLGVPVEQETSDGPGITGVAVDVDGDRVTIDRPDGQVTILSLPGQPERRLPLGRRDLGDLLAEEVRRLDADEPYADALSAATGVSGLQDRAPRRRHIWREPAAS